MSLTVQTFAGQFTYSPMKPSEMTTSKLQQTALAYLEGFTTLSPDSFLDVLAPTAIHKFAPASLNLPVSMTASAFAAHIGTLREVLDEFPVYPKEIFVNEAQNQVTIWATSETHFRQDVKDEGISPEEWLYRGEYIFILTMDESKEKVVSVLEFLDSKGTEHLRELMALARRTRCYT